MLLSNIYKLSYDFLLLYRSATYILSVNQSYDDILKLMHTFRLFRNHLLKALARASVEIFNCVKQSLTESLENPHYLFSHHDIASIANGVFLYSVRTRHLERRSGEGRREQVSTSANHCIPNVKLAGLSFVEDNRYELHSDN